MEIAKNQLAEVASYLEASKITLSFTPKTARFVAEKGYSTEFGAREVRRLIRSSVENPLSEKILKGDFSSGDTIEVDVHRGKIRFARKKAKKSGKKSSGRGGALTTVKAQ